MVMSQAIQKAARILCRGGVIAYPTEGVFGLGCLPQNNSAIQRILEIKQRDAGKGLVLIVSDATQAADWIEGCDTGSLTSGGEERPVTWIVPASASAPTLIRGNHSSIAIRVTAHPVARALCEAIDSPLVSTSANLSGRPPTRKAFVLRRNLGALVDYVVPGNCGPADGPSEIRNLASGEVLRPA